LDVSVVTVSKALRNKGSISAATRKRVLQRAQELNYEANWVAAFAGPRGALLPLVFAAPDIRHPFFAEIAKAVAESSVARLPRHHFLFRRRPSPGNHRSQISDARQVDGVILGVCAVARRVSRCSNTSGPQSPFVLIDRPMTGVSASFVGVDNEAIASSPPTTSSRKAAVASPICVALGWHRCGPARGLSQSLKAHKLVMPAEYVVQASYDDNMGYKAMQNLLQMTPTPDGVFCYNDPVAIGAMKAAANAGLNVPRDIAVIGAGNVTIQICCPCRSPLSTRAPARSVRRRPNFSMQQITSKRPVPPKNVLIVPKLVVRQSTQRRG